MQNDLKFWNAINLTGGIGPARFKKLADFFPNMETAWNATSLELKQIGFFENEIPVFLENRKKINPNVELEKLQRENIQIITVKDQNYPKLLKEIYDPPALLYVKGKFDDNNNIQPKIGIVGTRKMSDYGKQMTEELAFTLAKAGVIIISGLALGIDAIAHEMAVKAEQKTYAILGTGINSTNIYPRNNYLLSQKIIETDGAIISEFPFGTPGLPQNFPQRNRVISGLSHAILVIEAPENSGALITARFALEQNRDVFACPGSIYSQNSIGTNKLIKDGAHLVTGTQDIIEVLNLNTLLPKNSLQLIERTKIQPKNPNEGKIINSLTKEPTHIDRLAQITKISTQKLLVHLTEMELSSKVKNIGGMRYIKM